MGTQIPFAFIAYKYNEPSSVNPDGALLLALVQRKLWPKAYGCTKGGSLVAAMVVVLRAGLGLVFTFVALLLQKIGGWLRWNSRSRRFAEPPTGNGSLELAR